MKLFLIIYNLSGAVVHTFGPVDQSFERCQEIAARATMQAVDRGDIEQLVFNCEYRRARPATEDFIKPRRAA